MCSKGKYMTGHMIIGRPECFYDEMKVTENGTLSDDRLQNLKELGSVYVLSDDLEYPVIQQLSGPVVARLTLLYFILVPKFCQPQTACV
jgi:hypothetical protein